MIKAGSIPTGERWFILGVNRDKNRACVAGWPPTIASLDNFTLVAVGEGITEEERRYRGKEFGKNWE